MSDIAINNDEGQHRNQKTTSDMKSSGELNKLDTTVISAILQIWQPLVDEFRTFIR